MEGVDGLCYNGIPGQPSEPMVIDLEPNSAKTVNFPVVPVKAGKFAVTVTAISTNLGIVQIDKIEKYLYVVVRSPLINLCLRILLLHVYYMYKYM